MIGLEENFAGPQPALGVLAMMSSLDAQLSLKEQHPVQEAQELVYDAMEAISEDEKLLLLLTALELDPGNIDALLGIVRNWQLMPDDEIQLVRKIVALAERRLGPEVFEKWSGHFWGAMETRPYMRARQQLAEALRFGGELEAAVVEWEGMLQLNPNDNQGIRYELLTAYLTLNRLDAAAGLIARYNEIPFSVVFAWGRMLERWLQGDLDEARRVLESARKQNPHMEAYVTGRKKIPKLVPASYAIGSKEEAMCYAEVLRTAWESHPLALKWLAGQRIKSKGKGAL